MLTDSKLFFLRHAVFAGLKRLTRPPLPAIFHAHLDVRLFLPWMVDATFVAYPKSGLGRLERLILAAAEYHAAAATNTVSSYSELRHQFPFLPALRFTHAGSSWRNRVLDEGDLHGYCPGEWVSGGKIVFLHRDPREVLAATFEDLRFVLGLRNIEPAEVIENAVVGLRKMARFTNRWRAWCSGNPQCLMLRCEALASDPANEIEAISDFCGFGFGAAAIKAARETVSPAAPRATNGRGPGAGPRAVAAVCAAADGGRKPNGHGAHGASFQELFSEGERRRIEDIIAEEFDPEPRFS